MAAGGIEKGTILVVEDEDAVRALLVECLTVSGYKVLAAGDGADARSLFAAHRDAIVLVVSDVVMPGETGPSLARRLRVDRPDLPVLFISGYARGAWADDAPLGANDRFLPKPFSLDDLEASIRDLLRARVSGDPSAPKHRDAP